MTSPTPDIIDFLVGVAPGSRIDRLRAERPETRLNAQRSFLALFEPVHAGDVEPQERFAVAAFVSALHAASHVADFYSARLAVTTQNPSFIAAIRAESEKGLTRGPYGKFPEGPLTAENVDGLAFRVSEFNGVVLGAKLSAALEHAHLLVYRPRAASAKALQKLLDAGWSTSGIVTLSQIVAFLSFQIRVVTGLTALAASVETKETTRQEVLS